MFSSNLYPFSLFVKGFWRFFSINSANCSLAQAASNRHMHIIYACILKIIKRLYIIPTQKPALAININKHAVQNQEPGSLVTS